MADFESINGIAAANIESINGTAKSAVANVGGITTPSSGPTASDSLVHWWKMDEGSTTSATDYGSAVATGTALTMSGVTAVSGSGPSALSSPNHVSTDGVNDTIQTRASNGATKTSIGELFENDVAKSIALWIKVPANQATYDTLFNVSNSINRTEGTGLFFGNYGQDALWFWWDGWNASGTYDYSALRHPEDVDTGWSHLVFTYPTAGTVKIYLNGALDFTFGTKDPVNTTLGTIPSWNNVYLAFGCIQRTAGGADNPRNFGEGSYSDIRLYNKELSLAEVAAIHAGDW